MQFHGTWRQLAERAGVPFGPTMTWRQLEPVLPESAEGRPLAVWEGHLELNTASALFDLLGADGSGPYCFAFDLVAVIRADRHERLLYSAPTLDHRQAICSDAGKPAGVMTPSYVWPDDKRWIVWTDYDLTSTFLAVTADAAATLAARSDIETSLVLLTDRVDSHADEQSI